MVLGAIRDRERLVGPPQARRKFAAVFAAGGERCWEAEIQRLGGALSRSQLGANAVDAEDCFERALHTSRSQEAKSLELRAAMSLARSWQAQGKVDQARDLLAPIYAWFTEGFDTADLKRAKALLDRS